MPKKGKQADNRFRFQSFSEQISSVSIDVHRNARITSQEIPENDKDTFFRQSLEKWSELNCSIDYTELYRKLIPLSRSFNQLVYNKDNVVQILKEFLTKKESLAHEACLELLAQLSKDLLDEFYSYFDEFFPLLVKFLQTRDTKLIENTFVCFAYTFKFLWKWMLKDMKDFFRKFSVLLSTSQKLHVKVFASEAFAFLIRKSKDKEKIITFLFEQVDGELNEGIGHLLFHTIKGIKSQLSLNSDEFLKTILDSLHNDKIHIDEITQSLKITWNSALRHCSIEHASSLSITVFKSIKNYFELSKSNIPVLKCFLQLLITIANFNNGQYINAKECLMILSVHIDGLADVGEEVQVLASKLIKLPNGNLSDKDIMDFLSLYLERNSLSIDNCLQLFRLLIQWYRINLIKPLILSFILQKFENINKSQYLLEFLVELIYNVDPRAKLLCVFDMNTIEDNSLNFSISRTKAFHRDVMKDLTAELWQENPSLFWFAVVVLLHTRFTPTKDDLESLHSLVESLLDKSVSVDTEPHIFGLSFAIICYQTLKRRVEVPIKCISASKIKNLVSKFSSNEHVLQAFNQYIYTTEKSFSESDALKVLESVKENLNSPFKLHRLLTLKIFQGFNEEVFHNEDDTNILNACVVAENVEAGLETYRDRMMHIQKLCYRPDINCSKTALEAVLRYLIGNFYVNFSLIWEPTTKVIVTYTEEDTEVITVFWDLWIEILKKVVEHCEHPKVNVPKVEGLSEIGQTFYLLFENEKSEHRPDYHNFRELMWKAMSHFPSVVERRSRFVMPLFFQFIENEYTQADELYLKSQNISKERLASQQTENEELQKELIKTHNKHKIKTLCAYLDVFKHFKDPKSISKEKTLFKLYLEFLTNKEYDVQKKTLDCLHTYKFPYLKPYLEIFEKLMDDTSFREELVKICSQEEPVFKADHKEKLMPILIRLLYGRLQRRSGLGMSGKSGMAARRNIIMQFMAQCSNDEIKTFIDLITDPLKLYKDLEITSSEATIDIKCTVPLQRQTSFCNMFSTIVTRLRKQATAFLPCLLNVLLKVIWSNSWCLEYKKEEVALSFHSRMKELRTLGLIKLIELFNTIPEFDYQGFIEKSFEAAVWPKLKQLPIETCQNSSPLFHLIQTWSKNNRFFPLLCKENSQGDSLVSKLFELLDQKSLSNDMEKNMMIVIHSLLKTPDFEESETVNALTISESFKEEETIGCQIIKPFVPRLLQYLYHQLAAKTKNLQLKSKQKIGSLIPHIQLSILAEISKFVTDSELCEKMIDIFLPILHSVASDEVQLNIITTIKNLLPQTVSTERHLSLFPPLFSCFHANKPRKILCQVYLMMSENHSVYKQIASYVDDLNSWEVKRLEEPDYNRRLAAYRSIVSSLNGDKEMWHAETILPILQNCFFFVNGSNDMSLRDASSSCIEAMIQMIARSSKEDKNQLFDQVVVGCILPSIMHGLKLKNSVPRYEHIHFLEILVKTFEQGCLNDLKQLTSSDTETDFFQNIRHVQMHRRTRAVHQLTALASDKKLSNKTLFNYILPMISHSMQDNLSKTKDHNLLTATIDAIGAIVKGFPWSKYSHVLKHYLTVLRKEKRNKKTVIRAVVVVLNNFPFDLSNVKIEELTEEEHKGKKKLQSAKQENQNNAEGVRNVKPMEVEEGKKQEENIDEDMENEDEMEEFEVEKITEEEEQQIDQQSAERIFKALSSKILPQLHRFFTKKSRTEHHHKKSNNHSEDEEDILKVPVAFAIVKLLQHLPKSTLMSNLSGTLLRVSQSLKSQARDVREVARDTLKKIAASLGSGYLSMVFKEMRTVLQRGYQLHVLGFTVHTLLESMQSEMKGGDLDGCATLIMEMVCEELFGTVAEEKTIQGITVKLHEAKSKKSNDIIEILATFVTSGSFASMIRPLKEILDSTQDHKTRRKIEEAFRRMSVGLSHNQGVSPEDHLLFIHGTISNTISTLFEKNNNRKKKTAEDPSSENKKANLKKTAAIVAREDIYLLPDKPIRTGVLPTVSKFTNEHVLIEFGLQQLHTGLKRSKFSHSDAEHCRMLDPFVELLVSSITSKHTRLVTLTIRCITMLVRFPLPALRDAMNDVTKHIFKIIKKYARAGAAKGDNHEMIVSSFKAMTTIIRDRNGFKVSTKQLQILMTYVEEDIYDSSRQATALPLLKAILMRKLSVKEMVEVMEKIAELSIRDADTSIRLQCRQLMMTYLVEYPLGKKMTKHFDFYISNLSYEEETGRVSSLEMFAVMFNKFPVKVIQEFSSYFFIPLVMMLINDESAFCRKMTGSALKLLIAKVGAGQSRDELFGVVLNWSKQDKVQLRQVSMQLFGTFVEVEGENINARLNQLIPVLLKALQQGVKTDQDDDDESSDESEAGSENEADVGDVKRRPLDDKCLFNSLSCIGKLFTKLPTVFQNEVYNSQINEFLRLITELLLHSHSWVRLSASQLFGVYFSFTNVEEIVNSKVAINTYLNIDTQAKVKDLCLIFYEQLKDSNLSKEIAEQATKNLVYLFKLVRHLNRDNSQTTNNNLAVEEEIHENEDEHEDEAVVRKHITIKVLITKMGRLATFEALRETKDTIKRTCVFRWIAAICVDGHQKLLLPYLTELLRPLYREISNAQQEESDLVKLAQEVLDLVRGQFDKQTFAEVYAKVQKTAHEKRETRKRKLAVEAVAEPEKFAIRKQKLNLAKREQKKRKLYERKPELKFKKIRSEKVISNANDE